MGNPAKQRKAKAGENLDFTPFPPFLKNLAKQRKAHSTIGTAVLPGGKELFMKIVLRPTIPLRTHPATPIATCHASGFRFLRSPTSSPLMAASSPAPGSGIWPTMMAVSGSLSYAHAWI